MLFKGKNKFIFIGVIIILVIYIFAAAVPMRKNVNKNSLLNNNLSRIVRWFKGRTTFEARKNNPLFAWQPNYYEHVIRNKKSFVNIQHYIINNPIHWNNDKLYTQPK